MGLGMEKLTRDVTFSARLAIFLNLQSSKSCLHLFSKFSSQSTCSIDIIRCSLKTYQIEKSVNKRGITYHAFHLSYLFLYLVRLLESFLEISFSRKAPFKLRPSGGYSTACKVQNFPGSRNILFSTFYAFQRNCFQLLLVFQIFIACINRKLWVGFELSSIHSDIL